MTPLEFHTAQLPTIKKKHHDNREPEELHIYDCPFCGKEQHLHYFPETTTWDCKVCSRKGNVYVFIQLLYNEICTQQTKDLAHEWKLPNRVFADTRFNPLNDTYVIPTFKLNKLNNLYKVEIHLNKIFGTPGLPATLYNWEAEPEKEMWICEGQKDKKAAEAIIGQGREITVTAVPGAHMFKEGWSGAYGNRDVVILFDNDDPGKAGAEKILSIFTQSPIKPKSLQQVVWPPDTPDKYDIRDLYIENKGRTWALLQKMIEPIDAPESVKVTTENIIEDFSCDSHYKSMEVFRKAYHTTMDMEAAVACTMASIYSINIDGEQVWFKILAQPGASKSTIAKAVSASDHVFSLSTFKGLFSGYKDGDDKDHGLIPLIEGKALIVKDADTLLKQANIEQIMSELRDFYDKDSSVRYRTGAQYSYQNVRSAFILFGTQVLRRADQSFLGERLLTLEMDVLPSDQEKIEERMMQRSIAVAMGDTTNPETAIMSAMKGWLNHLRETELDTQIPLEFQGIIKSLCGLAARMRTQVDRDFKGKLLSPAMPELPTRLIGQMVTCTLALGAVFGKNEPDEDIYRIITKILRDTTNPRSHRFQICDVILDNPAIPALEIVERSGLDKSVVANELRDLIELRFVRTKPVEGRSPGYKADGYILDQSIAIPLAEITR